MDLKAESIMNYYRQLIQNQEFDEYDILGFLIFIRNSIKSNGKYPFIVEFTDLIAHRERERGIIMNCIRKAIYNKYRYYKKSRKICGYRGIQEKDWRNEWISFGEKFGININEDIIREITLCIYSLAQKTQYNDKNLYVGRIEFYIEKSTGTITLLTTEGNKDSLYICFSKYKGYEITECYEPHIPNKEILYTNRNNNGRLELRNNNGVVLTVKMGD